MADDPILSPPLGALTPDELGVAPAPPAPVAPTPGPSVYQNPRQKLLQDAILFMATMTRNPGLLHGLNVGQQQLEQARLLHEQQVQQQFRQQQAEYDRKAQAIQADTERRRSLYGTNLPKLKAQVDKATSQDEYDAAIHAWAQGLQSQSLRVTPQRLMQDVGPFRGAAKVADEALDDYEKKPAIQQTFQQNPHLLWNATIQVGGRPMLYKDAWTLSGRPVDAQGNPVMTPAGGPATQDDVLLDGKPAKLIVDVRNKKVYDLSGQEITNAATRVRPMPKPAQLAAPGMEGTDPKAIAQEIMEGRQPPTTQGLYRYGAAVRSELARNKYDLARATQDWQATTKYLSTLNSQGQVRLRQAVNFAYESLPLVDDLATQWKATGFPPLNRAQLMLAKNGFLGEKKQIIATKLEAQIRDMQAELAVVYRGGNAPTDEAMKKAGDMLNADWGERQLKAAVDLIRQNLAIRRNSINTAGMAGGNEYLPPSPIGNQTDPAATGRDKLSSR